MRLFFTIFTVLSLFLSTEVKGQAVDRSLVAEGLAESSTGEKIYVHYNTSLLFPGEYFLYSVYNLRDGSGEASDFSKIAYVEMIGEDGEPIFRQKVKLEEGRGSADFFIPTSTSSGNYKLIAYTNWMKNLKNTFFEGDLVVINPYQSNQKKLLKPVGGEALTSNEVFPIRNNQREQRDHFEFELNKNRFENRERVQINLNAKGTDVADGRYSLSVRNLGDLPIPNTVDPASAISSKNKTSEKYISDKMYLPELRGQIVSGRIISENNSVSIENRKVALSIPSEKGFVQIAFTNKEGQFFFNLDRELRDEKAVLELIGDGGRDLEIRLDSSGSENIDPDLLSFTNYTITPEMEEKILQRSLYNQIENAYFTLKPDTLAPVQEKVVFPKNLVETYNLDDYTRFKGVPDTFVEIIKSAWVKREGSDNRIFEVRGLIGHLPMRLNPLVMVDGILVQDHSALINYDARRIQTIKIIRDKIYLGPEIFQGAVLVETIDGDFPEQYITPNAKRVELVHPEISKRYFQQVYTSETKDNRIPDYRFQLLWKPSVELKDEDKKIEFFTSDIDGDFEVVLEGFTESGKPVSIRKIFTVE